METVMNAGAPAPVENVQPTAPPDGAPVEAVKPAPETPKPDDKKEHWASKRIKEISDDRNYWRDLAMRQSQPPQQQQAPEPDGEEPEKTLEGDFKYDTKAYRSYLETRAEARAEKAAARLAERYRVEQEAIGRRAKFDERVDAFRKTAEDFDDVVRWKGDPRGETPISEGMADFLMDSDEAGPLLYYLGNNASEASKLARLSPAKAGAALAKLEDRLVSERKKAAEKPVSQAPPPPPTVEGAGEGSTKAKPDDPASDTELSDAEWTRRRNAQTRQRTRS